MQLTLDLSTDNDSFSQSPFEQTLETLRILDAFCAVLESEGLHAGPYRLHDANGNALGAVKISGQLPARSPRNATPSKLGVQTMSNMPGIKRTSQIHRFHDTVAVYIGGCIKTTAYLTVQEADELSAAITACAESIRAQPSFAESTFDTRYIERDDGAATE